MSWAQTGELYQAGRCEHVCGTAFRRLRDLSLSKVVINLTLVFLYLERPCFLFSRPKAREVQVQWSQEQPREIEVPALSGEGQGARGKARSR